MTPDLPLWYHSPFTLSLALQLRLTWILGRRAVQCPIQTCWIFCSWVKFSWTQRKGKTRLYDGSVVNPLGSYTFTVSRNGGSKGKIKFDILDNAPWLIMDGRTCIDQGCISLGTEVSVHSLTASITNRSPWRNFEGISRCIHRTWLPAWRISHWSRSSHQASAVCSSTSTTQIKVLQPTEWISNLVAVQKPVKLRVCVDLRDLNRAIKSPKYQMPTVDEVLPKLSKAKVFTV